MQRRTTSVLVLVLAGVLASVGTATASPIIVRFAGEVTSFGAFGPFVEGDLVIGKLVYEPDGATDSDSDPDTARYLGSSFSLRIRGYEFTQRPSGIVSIRLALNSSGSRTDILAFRSSASGPSVLGNLPEIMQFALTDFPSTSLMRAQLPTLDDWDAYHAFLPELFNVNFVTFGPPGSSTRVDWKLTSFAAVPEPGTGTLLLAGLSMLAASVERRRRSGAKGAIG